MTKYMYSTFVRTCVRVASIITQTNLEVGTLLQDVTQYIFQDWVLWVMTAVRIDVVKIEK